MKMSYSLFTAALLGLAVANPVVAQIVVAPPAVFISDREPFGTFLVLNQSTLPQEVEIDFRFGYPVSDPMGTLTMAYGDTLDAADRSLRPHVRAFPRQFVLAPGSQQVIRITGRPDAEMPDGTYWTRIVTTSTPRSEPFDTASVSDVRAQVIFRLEQVTTLLYRKGRASTGVGVADLRVVADDASVGVLADLVPEGNSPFHGQLSVRMRDATGRLVAEDHEDFALYVPMTRLLVFGRDLLPPGDYVGELVVTSDRNDMPREQVLGIEPVVREFRFRID